MSPKPWTCKVKGFNLVHRSNPSSDKEKDQIQEKEQNQEQIERPKKKTWNKLKDPDLLILILIIIIPPPSPSPALLLWRVTHEGCSLYSGYTRTTVAHRANACLQDEAKNDPDGSAPIGKFSPFYWAQAG